MSFDSQVAIARLKYLVTDKRLPRDEKKRQQQVVARLGPMLMKCDSQRPYGLIHERNVDKSRVIRALERFTGETVFTVLPVAIPANRRPDWARHDVLGPNLFDMVSGTAGGQLGDEMRRYQASFDERLVNNTNEAQDRLLTAARHLAEKLAIDIGGDFDWAFPLNNQGSGCFAVAEISLFPVMVHACYAAAAHDFAAAERAIDLVELMRTVPIIAPKKIERGRWYVLVGKEIS